MGNTKEKTISVLLIISGLLLIFNLEYIGFLGVFSVILGVVYIAADKAKWIGAVSLSTLNIIIAASACTFWKLYNTIAGYLINGYKTVPNLVLNSGLFNIICIILDIVVIALSIIAIVIADKQLDPLN